MLSGSGLSHEFLSLQKAGVSGAPSGFTLPLTYSRTTLPFSAAPGTDVGTISGKETGSTLVAKNTNLVVNGDKLQVGTATGALGFVEPGRFWTELEEKIGSLKRSIAAEVLMLPTGVALGDPWTPFVNDTWVANAYLQEDLAEGPVASWPSRGFLNNAAVQADSALQPAKLAGTGGVEFPASSAHNLAAASHSLHWIGVRGTLTIFRVDKTSGGLGTTIITNPHVDGTSSAYTQASSIRYLKLGSQAYAVWRDPGGTNSVPTPVDLNPNYSTWCFVVHYHRNGELFVKFNGKEAIKVDRTTPFNPGQPDNITVTNYLGSDGNALSSLESCKFAIDSRFEFIEMSDELIAKTEWWAAQRAGIALPAEHKYFSVAPVVDVRDFPHAQNKFNRPEWERIIKIKASGRDFSNKGNPLPASIMNQYSVPIFNADFRTRHISPGNALTPNVLYSIGGLAGNTVGVYAPLYHVGQGTEVYPHDAVNGHQTIRAIALGSTTSATGEVSTVNKIDEGISFKGQIMWHVRYKMAFNGPKHSWYFPCSLWFYNFRRARDGASAVFEVDTSEIDGTTGYHNGMAFHMHEGIIKAGWHGRPTSDYPYQKMVGTMVTVANGFSADIDQGDGNLHDLYLIVDEDTKTIYYGMDNQEFVRFPWTEHWRNRLHLILNNAIRTRSGMIAGQYCDMIWDFVRAYKKPADIAKTPVPFTSRPTITGNAYVGLPLTCNANVDPALCSQVRTEWYYEDGFPITTTIDNVFYPTATDAGLRVKCKVVAVGHEEYDEAWSELSPLISAGSASIASADLDFANDTYTVNGTTYNDFDALKAGVYGLSFRANGTRSKIEPGNVIVPFVAKNTPRIDSRGLLYEGTAGNVKGHNTMIFGASGSGGWTNRIYTGPNGVDKVAGYWETTQTSARRLADVNIGTTAIGMRSTCMFIAKAGQRNFVCVEGYYSGASRTYYNLQTGVITLGAGVTASMTQIGTTGWWICHWSRADTQATTNASISLHIRLSTSDTGSAYPGDVTGPAVYLALYQVINDTTLTQVPTPWFGGSTRAAETLQLPFGINTKSVVATVVDPLTLAETTETFTGVSGDWLVPYMQKQIVKRLVIS